MLETRLYARNQDDRGIYSDFPGEYSTNARFRSIYMARSQTEMVRELRIAIRYFSYAKDWDRHHAKVVKGLENLLDYVGQKTKTKKGGWRYVFRIVSIDCTVGRNLP